MKTVIDINIGRTNFIINEDALIKLRSYFTRLENSIQNINDREEIMEDIEIRTAEIFQKNIKSSKQVVTIEMVNEVIECIGEIDPLAEGTDDDTEYKHETKHKMKKLYRNPDDKKIAGVCGGIATYFDVDSTFVRAAFIITALLYGSALVAYLILYIIMPDADTTIKKMRMRGEAITPENLKKNL